MIFTDEMLNSLPVISEDQDVSDFCDPEEIYSSRFTRI